MSGCATFQDRGVPPGGEYGYQFVIRHELNPRVYIYTSEVYRTHTEARAALAEHLILFPSQAEYAEVLGVPYPDDGNAEWPQLPS